MITVFIVEDEKKAKRALEQMLQLVTPQTRLLGAANNVTESVQLIKELKPDLILMDVEIVGGTGFDVIMQIPDFKGKVIFTTAYARYAVEAFKYSALDYLLKPIHSKELSMSLNKAISQISLEEDYQKFVKVLKENQASKSKKIVLKTAGVEHVVEVKNIVRIQADGAYCTFYLEEGKVTVSRNLKHFASFLDEQQFVRCHQSHLVNTKYVAKILKLDFLLLKNGDKVPISSRKRSMILEKVRGL